MNVTIDDIMVKQVMTATPHQTVGHVRGVMREHGVSALPVVDPDNEPVGIVTVTDLLEDRPEGAPISTFMTEKVYTVPQYDQPHVAARVMRNHRIHHVVVTHEQKVVGILSTFDLLRLVEDHRFTMKQPPTASKKGAKRQ
jgi:signal-transduction protein with cAMP-binding, CBS, and nucleotidyltransferase domain